MNNEAAHKIMKSKRVIFTRENNVRIFEIKSTNVTVDVEKFRRLKFRVILDLTLEISISVFLYIAPNRSVAVKT